MLEGRDRRLGKKKKEEGGKEFGRWSRVKEPDREPGMGTCHSSDEMIEHGWEGQQMGASGRQKTAGVGM